MSIIDKIKSHAESIMANGGPKTPDEIYVMKIFNELTSKKAGNAGKRTRKNHNKNW